MKKTNSSRRNIKKKLAQKSNIPSIPASTSNFNTEENVSHLSASANNEAVTDSVLPSKPRKKRKIIRRKYSLLHLLQIIGLIIAFVAIPLVFWQGYTQSAQRDFEEKQRHVEYDFEEKQRVVELSIELASFWETQFDFETRYRARRFQYKFKNLNTLEEKESAVNSIISTPFDSEAILKNKFLYDLIAPDLSSKNSAKITEDVAVARYRSSILRFINTLEAIAIVRKYSKKSPEAIDVIDNAYTSAIRQNYEDFALFIEVYRKVRNPLAWQLLIQMVKNTNKTNSLNFFELKSIIDWTVFRNRY